MKNRFLQLQRNLYYIRLQQIIVKPGTHAVCGKCEFLSFHFSVATKLLKIIVNLKDWLIVLSA